MQAIIASYEQILNTLNIRDIAQYMESRETNDSEDTYHPW
jgi:hypothetical protein